ncbi:MAG: CYTH domain-containing protein [Candidatus Poribacteria bacterium]
MAHEIEAKFPVGSAELFDRIRATGTVAGHRMTAFERIPQRDTYYDTEDGALLRDGWSLRLREKGGVSLATFKGPFIGAHARVELEEPLTKRQASALRTGRLDDVDSAPVMAAVKHLGHGRVTARLRVDNIREAWYVHADGGTLKVCFDHVDYRVGTGEDGASAREYELELELQDGAESVLQKAADALAAQYGLQRRSQSKYERGVELLGVFE